MHDQLDTTLSWLKRLNPEAAYAYLILGSHPREDFTTAAAAALLGMPIAKAIPVLNVLTRFSLLTQHDSRRTMPTHTHIHAGDRANQLSEAILAAARSRMLDHYRSYASAANEFLAPYWHSVRLTEPANPNPFVDGDAAQSWLLAEEANLLAAISTAAGHEMHLRVYQLVAACWPLYERRVVHASWRAASNLLSHAARHVGDWAVERHAHQLRAVILRQTGEITEAIDSTHRALALAQDARDEGAQTDALLLLADLHENLGDNQAADAYTTMADRTACGAPGDGAPDEYVVSIRLNPPDTSPSSLEKLRVLPAPGCSVVSLDNAGHTIDPPGQHLAIPRQLRRRPITPRGDEPA